MSRSVKYAFTVFAVSLAAELPARARVPVPGLDVNELVRVSDCIVVGTVGTITEGARVMFPWPSSPERTIPSTAVVGTVDVHALVKGDAACGALTEIHHVRTDIFSGIDTIEWKGRRIYFLSVQDGAYRPANQHHASLVAGPVEIDNRLDPIGKVIALLGNVLGSADATNNDKGMALYGLQFTEDPRTAEAVRRGRDDPSAEIQARTALVLTIKDDVSGLEFLERVLLAPAGASGLPSDVPSDLHYGLSEFSNPAGIPILERLMTASHPDVRRRTVDGLIGTRSLMAIPILIRALDDTDQRIRIGAINGLSEITGLRMRLAINASLGLENEYANFWRNWAADQKIGR